MKNLLATSYKLLEEAATFKNSNTIKRVSISHLILVSVPTILILPVKNRVGLGFFCLTDKIR